MKNKDIITKLSPHFFIRGVTQVLLKDINWDRDLIAVKTGKFHERRRPWKIMFQLEEPTPLLLNKRAKKEHQPPKMQNLVETAQSVAGGLK